MDVRQLLMMSLPSPTSCMSAASPLAKAVFFSKTISCERRASVSRMCIIFLAYGFGRWRSSARVAGSDKIHESCLTRDVISGRRRRVGLRLETFSCATRFRY